MQIIRAKIIRQILLFQRPWPQRNSQTIDRRIRPSSLRIDLNQKITGPLQDGRPVQAKRNSDLVVLLTFGEDSLRFPWRISFRNYRSHCATFQSIEIENQRDPPTAAWIPEIGPEGGHDIRSRMFKMFIWQQYQLTGWVSSNAKWTILFLGLWQWTIPDFSIYLSLTICWQPAEMKWFQGKRPQ
jgi:hypothetical protein